MERLYYSAKENITHFKLDFCCWFAPVRVGLLFVGYVNIIIDLICMIGIANEGFSPTITLVQEKLIEDSVSKPVPILAYAIELSFNVVLLSAVYRRDIPLLRVFLYYTLLTALVSIMVYSIILAAVPLQIQISIVFSFVFQMYCILLIRSVMLEIKMQNRKYEVPKLVMSSLLKDRETTCIYDPNNGKLQEVTIADVPKKQEVQITVIGDEKIKDAKVTEIKKVEEVKLDTDIKKGAQSKKDAEVKVQIETKDSKYEKKKEENKSDSEKKKEEKKSEEAKKKEDKKTKEEKKREEKMMKEEKKKEEKKIKEEKKKEEKKSKDDKMKDEKITSLILKKYQDDKEAENEKKENDSKTDPKEISLQPGSEQPKE